MRVLHRVEHTLLRQRGHLFPWAPVCLGVGIGLYFAWPVEPGAGVYAAAMMVLAAGTRLAWRGAGSWSPLGAALALVALGIMLAGARAHRVAGPVLDFRYYGPIEGRVVALDRSASDALRVTLDRVRLRETAPHRTPNRVRVSFHGPAPEPQPGARIMTTGHLSPPGGPVEPGGYDFRRHAWFNGLGAVGYTRTPVLLAAPPGDGRAGLRIEAIRMAASARVRQVLPGDVGGFAAAVTTGDRSGVGQATLEALRASNLAHLLAISGLHMGLLAGFVFGGLRMALALLPVLALRWPVRKIAACGALVAAAGYLALSGGNVATERAFVMVAVMLGALLVDRRAISLRAVAVAALIVLALRPEALLGPGFQMSFAATTALVAVFGWMRRIEVRPGPRWLAPVLGVAISSAVAGLATAPIGAAHFNTLSHYGLAANLVSVPLMGTLVIPAAVLAACLAPLGLEWIGLKLMGLGLRWILAVAEWISGLDGAQGHVASPPPAVLPLIALGFLLLILWQGRSRLAGILPVLAAFTLWAGADRPAILVAESGTLVGVMTTDGRALSKARGAGFVAGVWLENDGDGAEQQTAAGRGAMPQRGLPWRMRAGSVEVIHVSGKRAAARMDSCSKGQLIVSSVPLKLTGGCEVFDPQRLRRTGSLSLGAKGLRQAADHGGRRLWSAVRDQ
ncbi:competence protein ComEC [Cribrihabitans marinus]|uniref:Competence protein ComEC n=1 Tax=Cribrihabitans marinus TaxID=1227549 RepID=A0A1H7E3I4_9RHOB|nr:ComEC/Rec2 family competence protein [Cribrihabitans marinus]GGH40343.1 hypothetical protein GCM10010973_36720 [Cribrihabitans marinus]SEK05125.1 competence protein ComEC [Cribrihabitans marinus]